MGDTQRKVKYQCQARFQRLRASTENTQRGAPSPSQTRKSEMSDLFPINAAVTEQNLIEEITGRTPQVEADHAPDTREPGDPVDYQGPDDEIQVGGRVEVEHPRDNA